MKKLLPLLVLVSVVVVSGCVQEEQLKDCGSDIDCYQQSAMKCEPAKVSVVETETQNGMTYSMGFDAKVRGFEGND